MWAQPHQGIEWPALPAPTTSAPATAPSGYVGLDMPWVVELNQPFQIDVSLVPRRGAGDAAAGAAPQPVEVRMEQTIDVVYEPRVFKLMPEGHQSVKATIKKSEGGLAQIIAVAQSPWQPAYAVVGVGFTASLRFDMDTLETGRSQVGSLAFLSPHGAPVSLGAPVTVHLTANKAQVRATSGEDWQRTMVLKLERGASSTPTFELRAEGSAPERAVLTAVLKINDGHILRDQKFSIAIVPQWWMQLLGGVLGGLLHAGYRTLTRDRRQRKRPGREAALNLFTGSLAGCMAYWLATWNVLGIKLETTSMRAFLVLGFLFAYLGVDAIVRRILPPSAASGGDEEETAAQRRERSAA